MDPLTAPQAPRTRPTPRAWAWQPEAPGLGLSVSSNSESVRVARGRLVRGRQIGRTNFPAVALGDVGCLSTAEHGSGVCTYNEEPDDG